MYKDRKILRWWQIPRIKEFAKAMKIQNYKLYFLLLVYRFINPPPPPPTMCVPSQYQELRFLHLLHLICQTIEYILLLFRMQILDYFSLSIIYIDDRYRSKQYITRKLRHFTTQSHLYAKNKGSH